MPIKKEGTDSARKVVHRLVIGLIATRTRTKNCISVFRNIDPRRPIKGSQEASAPMALGSHKRDANRVSQASYDQTGQVCWAARMIDFKSENIKLLSCCAQVKGNCRVIIDCPHIGRTIYGTNFHFEYQRGYVGGSLPH